MWSQYVRAVEAGVAPLVAGVMTWVPNVLTVPPSVSSDASISVAALMTTTWLAFLAFNIPYAALYFANLPAIDRYLLQPSPAGKPRSGAIFWRATKTMLRNVSLVTVLFAVLGPPLVARRLLLAQNRASLTSVPHAQTLVWEIVLSTIVEDTVFYFGHRLLHTPFLYARVHKMHHEFKAPVSVASTYASLPDFLFSNVVATVVALFVGCTSLASSCLWLTLRLFITTEVHSGYSFPWYFILHAALVLVSGSHPCFRSADKWLLRGVYAGTRHHDTHHAKTHCNYSSTLIFWDWVFGTAAAPDGERADSLSR